MNKKLLLVTVGIDASISEVCKMLLKLNYGWKDKLPIVNLLVFCVCSEWAVSLLQAQGDIPGV